MTVFPASDLLPPHTASWPQPSTWASTAPEASTGRGRDLSHLQLKGEASGGRDRTLPLELPLPGEPELSRVGVSLPGEVPAWVPHWW